VALRREHGVSPEDRESRAQLAAVAFLIAFVGTLVGVWVYALVDLSEDVGTAIGVTSAMLWGVFFIACISLME
jgi:ferric-dicitrate binding protein FerR (iron transport regulator)